MCLLGWVRVSSGRLGLVMWSRLACRGERLGVRVREQAGTKRALEVPHLASQIQAKLPSAVTPFQASPRPSPIQKGSHARKGPGVCSQPEHLSAVQLQYKFALQLVRTCSIPPREDSVVIVVGGWGACCRCRHFSRVGPAGYIHTGVLQCYEGQEERAQSHPTKAAFHLLLLLHLQLGKSSKKRCKIQQGRPRAAERSLPVLSGPGPTFPPAIALLQAPACCCAVLPSWSSLPMLFPVPHLSPPGSVHHGKDRPDCCRLVARNKLVLLQVLGCGPHARVLHRKGGAVAAA